MFSNYPYDNIIVAYYFYNDNDTLGIMINNLQIERLYFIMKVQDITLIKHSDNVYINRMHLTQI